MKKTAIIFPGQGSQYVGMGREFFDQYSKAKKLFIEADSILEYPLSDLIFGGPEEKLKVTVHTQPAILITSIVIWEIMKDAFDLEPAYMAGHSLGEYSALSAAGSLSFTDAVKLVRDRGKFMEEAVPNGEGTMAAIMGMERKELEDICDKVTAEGHSVQLANMNTGNQIVISGSVKGVGLAGEMAKNNGARRYIPLSVSGPFHSRLMQPAKDKLEAIIYETEIKKAAIPVVMNVTGKKEVEPEQIRQNLIKQVVSPVLWIDSIQFMIENGVDIFIEVGPGNVLSGLVKKIDHKAQTFSIENIDTFQAFKEKQFALKGGN